MNHHERDQTIAALYAGGSTMQEIGDAFGITRERIRQILEDHGGTDGHRRSTVADPLRILAAVRAPGVEQFTDAASLACVSVHTVRLVVIELGMHAAALRLFRLRKRARYARQLRALAERLGRTPGKIDCDRHGPSQAILHKWFGGMIAAQRAAGLTPNKIGRPKCEPMRGAA